MMRNKATYHDPTLDVSLTLYANETLADRMQTLAISESIGLDALPAAYGVQPSAFTWAMVLPVLVDVSRSSEAGNAEGDALCQWFMTWAGSTDYSAAWAAYCEIATSDTQFAISLAYNETRRNRLIAPVSLRTTDEAAAGDPALKKSATQP